jgi:hypothetical protein
MLRRLGLAAAVSELLAVVLAGVLHLAGTSARSGSLYTLAEITASEAFTVGWAVFFLVFIPGCLLYVRRSDVALDGDRIVRIAEARLDGRRSTLLRARSRRR